MGFCNVNVMLIFCQMQPLHYLVTFPQDFPKEARDLETSSLCQNEPICSNFEENHNLCSLNQFCNQDFLEIQSYSGIILLSLIF